MNRSNITLVLVFVGLTSYGQDCKLIQQSSQYFSASATGSTEQEARINALSMLAENISSVVSSRTDMLTKDDGQQFSNISKSTSVLRLQGVSYLSCDKNKKGFNVLAFVSKKNLEQSSAEVAVTVQQYVELMEQKQALGTDCIPEAYMAYLYTFSSPYQIAYTSERSRISNVQSYLASYLRNYLANVSLRCTNVKENVAYRDRQLTLALDLQGTNATSMKFELSIPEYNAHATMETANSSIDVIMTPDSRTTRFRGTLSLTAPQLEADLKDIADQVTISREVNLDADMSDIINIDFTIQRTANDLLAVPVIRHLSVRTMEWLSGDVILSTEQMPRLSAELKEITLRINGSSELMVTKAISLPQDIAQSSNVDSQHPGSGETYEFIISDLSGYQSHIIQQADAAFAGDATIFFYTDARGLAFRSSMPAIDKQSYNYDAGRYEVLVKPVRQIFFVKGDGAIEKDMGVINPQPGQALSYRLRVVPSASLYARQSQSPARSYLNGRQERSWFQEVEVDPAEAAKRKVVSDHQRRLNVLKRKAVLNYSMGIMGVGFGLYYRFLGNILNDGSSSASHTNTFDLMSNVCYIGGGAAIVMGIIRSAQISHLKKKWEVVPTPNINGAGMTVTYKF